VNVSVFGLGYVGAVTCACLANDRHTVIGADPNSAKVEVINTGGSPIIEKDVDRLIANAVQEKRLRATTAADDAVMHTDLSIVCVGTPSQLNGNLDLKFVRKACEEIGRAIRAKKRHHVVVMRSTMLPGSMHGVVIPTLEEASGAKNGDGFDICINPEFLREGTAVHDFYNPPKTVIGEENPRAGDLLATLYAKLTAPMIRCSIETAEMVKYADNAWHATKVAFANEIGSLAKTLGIDSHAVMDIFCQDTKLNISRAYLRPGFAFGGSCLPKDMRALTYCGRVHDLELPLLNGALRSNELHVDRGLKTITGKGKRKISILGLSFKAGTDDLRESPMVEIVERLIGKGYDLRIYDRSVNVSSLIGANREFVFNHIPHISRLTVPTLDDALKHGEVVVIGNSDPEFQTALNRLAPSQQIVDFVRIGNYRSQEGKYDGIGW